METITANEFFCGCDPHLFADWNNTPAADRPRFVADIVAEALENAECILDPSDVEATLDRG